MISQLFLTYYSLFIPFYFIQVYHVQLSLQDCPVRGSIGIVSPNPLQVAPNQNGYQARIEMIDSQNKINQIDDLFHYQQQFGILKIQDIYGFTKTKAVYYYKSNQSFILDKKGCSQSTLAEYYQHNAIRKWLTSDEMIDLDEITSVTNSLGPTALLIYAAVKSKLVQYLGIKVLDEIQAKHWFLCVTPSGPYMDLFFDSTSNFPVQLILNKNKLFYTFNYLNFKPITDQQTHPVHYPLGYGCSISGDSLVGSVVWPHFADTEEFTINLQASITNSEITQTIIQFAGLTKFQGIFSYDLFNGTNNSAKIVYLPKYKIDYVINSESGACFEEKSRFGKGSYSDRLRWPRDSSASYNLLDNDVLSLGNGTHYMGAIETDKGTMDVFEKTRTFFFAIDNGLYLNAIITYWFPVWNDRSNTDRHQAPDKILIRPVLIDSVQTKVPSSIEIIIAHYAQFVRDKEHRFDVSNCFNDPEQFTWIQVAFTGLTGESMMLTPKISDLVKSEFRKSLEFIPFVRLTETRVALFGNKIYVTAKLLERPSLEYDFITFTNQATDNPSNMIIREKVKDCAEICSDDDNCKSFSYCSDLTCSILSDSANVQPKIIHRPNCILYFPIRSANKNSSDWLLKSSKALISKIKNSVFAGFVNLNSLQVKAEDIYTVQGPNSIGRRNIDGNDDYANFLQSTADEYQIFLSQHKLLFGQTIYSIDFLSCLKLCNDDGDCNHFSYCTSHRTECSITSLSSRNISSNSEKYTVFSESCSIFRRDFIGFFNKIPGHSLVFDEKIEINNLTREECAQHCIEDGTLECNSFDYCTENKASLMNYSQSSCLLHTFHLSRNYTVNSKKSVLISHKKNCDHYSKKYSAEYIEFQSRELIVDSDSIVSKVYDVSLERCAVECSSSILNCNSFEFCENLGNSSIISSCKMVKTHPVTSSEKILHPTNRFCSVFVVKSLQNSNDEELSLLGNTLSLGIASLIFILAFVFGVLTIYYLYKKRSRSLEQRPLQSDQTPITQF